MRLLAPWLVAGMGVTGSGALAAMPYLGAGTQASRLILVQATPGQEPAGTPSGEQSPPDSFVELHEALAAARERLDELSRAAEAVAAGGELQRELAAAQAENRALRAELEALRAERDQLARASKEAEARAIEAEQAAEQTTAAARRIDQELVAVRWQNAQLNTSLQQAAARRAQIEAEARETQAALQSRMEQLEAAAATATSEVIRLRGELNAAEERIAAAAGAEAEKAQAAQRIRALETERDGLLGDLAELRASLEALQAAKAQLEAQIDQLHEAAANATDLARQNLLALEDRLRQLKGSLETIEPAGGAPEPAQSPVVERSDRRAALESPENGAAPHATLTAATGAAVQPAPTPAAPLEAAIDRMKSAHATRDPGADILDALPLEERLHVQGLLADLEGRVDEQGLTTIVPGGLLFAVNSETVQESAYDTLAKVAELISVYDDRKVLIVGHTDAVGDAAYNKHLSQRRAELVKRFFVDNFGVEEDRLATTGFGEERPIASDATPEGRRANRRVEILILN